MTGQSMTWVKICGMTNLEDALVAVEAGADAVGFVFYEKSPRFVTVETAREIVEKLPASVEKVGVFVRTELDVVADVSRRCRLTVAQIYPRAPIAFTDEFVATLPCRVIPAISARAISGEEIAGFYVSDKIRQRVLAVLIDSGNSERPGGTGETFDWKEMSDLMSRIGLKLIVAGGLTPVNVREAIETMNAWGVDVASGVEASPGKKDPEKVRAFVRAAREMDRKVG
jgi:phosphoribosylanthranilate isomerase